MKGDCKVEFLKYLIDTFGYNEPILSGEISFDGYSKPWINKELGKLCDSIDIIRFDKGVYYVPKNTLLGPSKLNPLKVIEKKYIADKNAQNGYYSGATFLNKIGLSTQVPNIVELYTNNETAKVREVAVGTVRVLLRKSRIKIDKANAPVQSFLELMNSMPPSFFNDERKQTVDKFIKDNNITRSNITRYASVFPDKAMRTLIESEIIYDVSAQRQRPF